MTLGMVAKVAVLTLLTLGLFPLSLAGWLAYGVWRWWRKRQRADHAPAARMGRYADALAGLERRLADIQQETEILARIRYTEWLIDHEQRKKAWLTHGVQLPVTVRQKEQDRFFGEMQRRLEMQQSEFQRECGRITASERKQIEYQARTAEIEKRDTDAARTRADALALERERIEAEREAVEKIAAALRGDLI